MSFSNWAPGEPNGHNAETIVEDVAEMYPYTYGYVAYRILFLLHFMTGINYIMYSI